MACGVTTPVPPTDTPVVGLPVLPTGSGPCVATSQESVITYTRPSYMAAGFSTEALSPPVVVESRTIDNWLGFNPQVAQAANIGIFRMRWIPPDAIIELSGDCVGVPVAEWVPEADICYEMVMSPVDVHAAADATSAVVAPLNVGDFAAVVGKTANGWLQVDGAQANAPAAVGYIPEAEANFSGDCSSLPTVQ
jgi:hypothetical protein